MCAKTLRPIYNGCKHAQTCTCTQCMMHTHTAGGDTKSNEKKKNWNKRGRKRSFKSFPALTPSSKRLMHSTEIAAQSFHRLCMCPNPPSPALRQSIESFFAVDSQEYKGPTGNKSCSPMSQLQSLSH